MWSNTFVIPLHLSGLSYDEDDWHAKEKEGLCYYEDGNGNSNALPFTYHLTRVSINKAQIWIYLFHLENPSFLTIKAMFRLLLKELDLTSFIVKCVSINIVEFMSLLSHSRLFVLFSLIHTDVWGYSRVSNIFGAWWFCYLYWWLHSGHLIASFETQIWCLFYIFYASKNGQHLV